LSAPAIWRSGRNRNSKAADWFHGFCRFMGYGCTEVLDGFRDVTGEALLIIPPGTPRMSDGEIDAVTEAVSRGTGLLSFFDNSALDASGKQRMKAGAPSLGLSEVLGLDVETVRERYVFPVSAHLEAVTASDPKDPLWDGVDLTGEALLGGASTPSFACYNTRTGAEYGTVHKTRTKAETARVLARTTGYHPYWAYVPGGDILLALNRYREGNAAYLSYEALPSTGALGLIPVDLLFFWALLRNLIRRVSALPVPRILQMPAGITNVVLRIDDAGTDEGYAGEWGDPFHDTRRVLLASPFPMAIAVETDKVSTALGEERLRGWEAEGHVIVCHTRGREAMTMDETEQVEDLRESREKLERILGHEVRMWSIPGDWNLSTENTMRLAVEAGYELTGEYDSLVSEFISPDACPVFPYLVRHPRLGVYVDILTASGWPAISREYNRRCLGELALLSRTVGIPCLIEFVTHVPQGWSANIGDWKAFMEDLRCAVARGSIRMSTLAEQLAWAKAREHLHLTGRSEVGKLYVALRNEGALPAREVAVDCGGKILSAACLQGELRVEEDAVIFREIPPGGEGLATVTMEEREC
jgi:peptidoglycan/xylan/chitin deacetylase (PgdA/CDA1 family)